jgi:NAD(P)-dependent dehydrogenase (short-subunit alcohol dehydrogenase family)
MNRLSQLMDMHGRCALITGAAGGLGGVMAATLAEMGANLILVDRPGAAYAPDVSNLGQQYGVSLTRVECDLESQQERAALMAQVQGSRDSLHVLVNNAGFVGTSGLQGWVTEFEQQSVETWRRALEVNLTAGFDLVKGLTPVLRNSGSGSVINIASIYGMLGPDYSLYEGTAMGNPAAYAASKGGLIQLSRWLATTLAPAIRVNTITPGGVFRNQPDAFVERYKSRTPLGRMATEDDFRGAVAYLASDMSAYVTGQNLMVDGGWGAW